MRLCFKHIQVNTYHTVVGKDLDIIYRAAQVLRNLPPDTSNRVITVRLQNMHKRAHTGVMFSAATVLHNSVHDSNKKSFSTSKVNVSLVDS